MNTNGSDNCVPEIVCSSNGPWFIAFKIAGEKNIRFLPVTPRKTKLFGLIKPKWTPNTCPTSYGDPGLALLQFQNAQNGERVMQADVLRVFEDLHTDVSHYLEQVNSGSPVVVVTYKKALFDARNAHKRCGECGQPYDPKTNAKGLCGQCAAAIFAQTGKLVTA